MLLIDASRHKPVDQSGSRRDGCRTLVLARGVRLPSWVRWGAGSGAIAVLPLVGGLVGLARAGWSPIDDEATISWRSWDVFAGHGPLVGAYTFASPDVHHTVFDPGPLLYWTFAIPVHVAPRIGLLVGVTLLGVASVLVACLAAAAAGGRAAAVTSALGAMILTWNLSQQFDGTLWNPYAGLAPFGAMLIVAWTVAGGRLGWWPCLVFLASFCSQTHLMYAPGAAVLLTIAPLLGVVARRRLRRAVGWHWAAAGTAVGALCWVAPLWQEVTASQGNMSALWTAATGSQGGGRGLDFGLRHLTRAVTPRSVWLNPPTGGANPFDVPSATPAIVVLTALLVIAALGWWRGQHAVTALSIVALIGDLTAVWVIGAIAFPFPGMVSVHYMQYLMWPLGAITWFALGYAAFVLLRSRVPAFVSARLTASRPRTGWASAAFGLVIVALAAVATQSQYNDAVSLPRLGMSGRAHAIEAADRIVALVGNPPLHGNRRLAIQTPEWNNVTAPLVMRTAYLLRVRGWTPAPSAAQPRAQLDPVYSPRPDDPVLGVSASPAPVGTRLLCKVATSEATLVAAYGRNPRPVHLIVWLRMAGGSA